MTLTRFYYFLLRLPVNLFFMIFYGVRFYGRNNMPRRGGVVVICNHQSFFDPPLLAAGLRRQIHFLAKKTLFTHKFFGGIIRNLRAVPLDRDGIGLEGIRESIKLLRGGEMLLVFPEGERTWDGNVLSFLPNSLMLAQRCRCTILPAALTGCFDAFPRTRKIPKFWGRIKVIYGKPLHYEEFKDLSETDLRMLCEQKVSGLLEQISHS